MKMMYSINYLKTLKCVLHKIFMCPEIIIFFWFFQLFWKVKKCPMLESHMEIDSSPDFTASWENQKTITFKQ